MHYTRSFNDTVSTSCAPSLYSHVSKVPLRGNLAFFTRWDVVTSNLIHERWIWIVKHDMKMLNCMNAF